MNRLIVCLAAILSMPSSWAEDWSYTLRPGDDIWSIARQFTGSGNRAEAIAQYNNVAEPKLIKPGQRINIPIKWLAFAPSSAIVAETTDNVVIQRASSGLMNNSRQRARAGDKINMGDRIITSEGSALIRFADGSTLAIAPASHILFNKLTEFGPAGMVDTHLRFAYGNGKANVKPQNRGNRFRIQTPEGVAAVRGTEFRVGHDVSGALPSTNTETLEGEVAFTQQTDTTALPQGFGIVASQNGVIKESLLAAPLWIGGGIGGGIGAGIGDGASQNLVTHPEAVISWQPVTGAHHYVVTWIDSNKPNIIFKQFDSLNTELNVDVPQGTYNLTVRAVSAAGIEGFDNQRELQVQALAPVLQQVTNKVTGPIEFTWQYPRNPAEFSLTIADAQGQQQHQIDTQAPNAQLTLPPGQYTWQVQAKDSAPSAAQTFTLRPLAPTELSILRNGRNATLTWPETAGVTKYALRVVPPGNQAAAQEIVVTGHTHNLSDLAFGSHRIELRALQADIASTPLTETLFIQRRPWWLLLLVIPLLTL